MKCFATLLVFLCLNFSTTLAQIQDECLAKSEMMRYYQLQDYSKRASGGNINIVYASLSVRPNMTTAFIRGHVNYHFKATGTVGNIIFDVRNELTIDSVIYHNQYISFVQSANHQVNIFLPFNLSAGTLDSLIIHYHGTPNLSTRAYTRNVIQSGPIIATLSEPYGAHYWWPCRENLSDKIDSLDVRITVDTMYKAASNGVLQSVIQKDSVHTFHWKHRYPIVTYLVAFSASRYTVYSDYTTLSNQQTMQIQNFVFPHNEADARSKTPETVAMIHLFDSLYGIYPFHKEQYAHTQFTFGGGMEHQTNSFMANFGYDLIAHELAHQWFGDKVTCGSWSDLWLNEGFATYSNWLCYNFLKPRSEWLNILINNKKDVLSEAGGSVMAKDTLDVGQLFNYRTTYQKGALVLHQLRWMIGDKAFFDGLKNYLSDSNTAYGFGRAKDLKYHLEQTSGMSLTDYFNDWITGEGYPIYTVRWQQKGRTVYIDVIQTTSHPSVALFNVPLPIQLKGHNIDTMLRIPINLGVVSYKIDLDFKVKELVFDPDEWILGKNNIQFPVSGQNGALTLYPNPSQGTCYIVLDDMNMKQWDLIDAAGRVVKSMVYDDALPKGSIATIHLNELAEGCYTFRFYSDNTIYFRKILIYQ